MEAIAALVALAGILLICATVIWVIIQLGFCTCIGIICLIVFSLALIALGAVIGDS